MRLGAAYTDIVAERFGEPTLGAGTERLGLFDQYERLAGVAVFFDYYPGRTVEMGMGVWRTGAATPSVMAHVLAYPFGQLGVSAVLMRCRGGDLGNPVTRLALAVGFKLRPVPHLYGVEDGFMGALTPEAWRASRLYREI